MADTDVQLEPPKPTGPTTTPTPQDYLQDPLAGMTLTPPGGNAGLPGGPPGGGSFKAALGKVADKVATTGGQDGLNTSTLKDPTQTNKPVETPPTGTDAPQPEAPKLTEEERQNKLATLKSPGAVEVDDTTIDEALLQDTDAAAGSKVVPQSSYTDAKQQQAYTYMLWVAEYEQKESLVHFFEKQSQTVRERVLAEGIKANVLPATKTTPAQDEAEAKQKAAEAERKRQEELAERARKAKEDEEKNKGVWGWFKRKAAVVGNAIADGAKWLGNKVVDGAKAVGNGIANGVSAIGKAVGYEKIDWAKLAGMMRTFIQDEKQGNTGDFANKDPSKALDYVGYGQKGGTAASKVGGKIADHHADKVGDMSFQSATQAKDGIAVNNAAERTSLSFGIAGNGLGLVDNTLSMIDAGKRLANKDSDRISDVSAGLDMGKALASTSNNIVGIVKTSGDLTGASGAVMTAAQLGLALGIGQIVGGTADLIKGILNVIDGASGRAKLKAMQDKLERLEGVIEPKMYASVMQALGTAESQIMSGATDILTGAAGIVGGALLIALGISNPIGLIIIGVAGAIGGLVAAYKWKKHQDTMRKLVDDHPTFKQKIEGMTTKYREAKERDAKAVELAKGTDNKPKQDPFAKYIDDHAGIGDKVKGKVTGDKDNDGPKEAIRRIVLQEHGFVDVQDYQSFHNETLGKYLYALLQKGDPKNLDEAVRGEVEAAATVVSTLGIRPTWDKVKGLVKPTSPEAIASKM